MSRIPMKTWCAALAVAVVFGVELSRAGEVTVVGSRWSDQCPLMMEPCAVVPVEEGPMPGMSSAEEGPIDGKMPDGPVFGEPGEAFCTKTASLDELFPNGYFWEGMSCRQWTVDYRCRCMTSSNTSYQYGKSEPPPIGWSPYYRHDSPLNSLWHGVRVGIEDPIWGAQFEWLMPQQGIQGEMSNTTWNPPNFDGSYTDLQFAKQRWSGNFGMMIDFGMQFQMTQRTFRMPIEIWPTAGFRWQRFQIKGVNPYYVKEENQWQEPPYAETGDKIDFNQQYYTGYLGSQFRTRIRAAQITFQADWGYSWANNVTHDWAAEGMDFTMDYTQGDCWHLGVTAEVPLSKYIFVGFQYDHLVISTIGRHRHLNLPRGIDEEWNNGVQVGTNQNWITGFVRVRY